MADETMMPAPSKVEKLKERMRNKQGPSPAKGAAPTPTMATPPPTPTTIKHICGHEAPFREIPKDKFRDQRYQKELKRPCPTCRETNKEANQKAQEENRAKKKALSFGHYSDPATGVGYSFTFHHLGVAQWEWSLVKTSSSQPVEVGKGTCKSLRMGMAAINEILAKLGQQEAAPGPTA